MPSQKPQMQRVTGPVTSRKRNLGWVEAGESLHSRQGYEFTIEGGSRWGGGAEMDRVMAKTGSEGLGLGEGVGKKKVGSGGEVGQGWEGLI